MARTRIMAMCAPLPWHQRYDLGSRPCIYDTTLGHGQQLCKNIIHIGQER